MRQRARLVVAAVAVALVAAACGGDDDSQSSAGNAPTAQAEATTETNGDSAGSCMKAAGFTGNVQDKGTQPATGAEVTLEAGDFFFSPTCISDTQKGTVSLTVQNTGTALHNVSIEDQDIDQDVEPGETITVDVKVGSSPVQFVCKYHFTSGMVGALLPVGS